MRWTKGLISKGFRAGEKVELTTYDYLRIGEGWISNGSWLVKADGVGPIPQWALKFVGEPLTAQNIAEAQPNPEKLQKVTRTQRRTTTNGRDVVGYQFSDGHTIVWVLAVYSDSLLPAELWSAGPGHALTDYKSIFDREIVVMPYQAEFHGEAPPEAGEECPSCEKPKHDLSALAKRLTYAGPYRNVDGRVQEGPGIRALGTGKRPWYGPGYCGICGDRGTESGKLVPIHVTWWDCDDGWKTGVLCQHCAEDRIKRGPDGEDYAVAVWAEKYPLAGHEKAAALSEFGDDDATYSELGGGL